MRVDAIVLGAGIVGVSIAIHLVRRGRDVVLVDRQDPGEGTSRGNAGLIQREGVLPVPFPQNPLHILKYGLNTSLDMRYHLRALPSLLPYLARYYLASRADSYQAIVRDYAPFIAHSVSEHADLVDAAGAGELIVRTGWLEAYRTPSTFEEGQAEADWLASAYGIVHETLDVTGLHDLEPDLRGGLVGAIHWKEPWTVRSPLELTRAYIRYFQQLGGRFLQGDASTLTQDGTHGWSMTTAAGTITARDAVLALGPWTGDVTRRLGYRIPFAVQRGYSMHYRPEVAGTPRHWIADRDRGFLLAPMAQGIRLTTGAEFAFRDAPKTPVQLDLTERAARQLYALGERLDPEPWMGARPCIADMKPVIGPAPRHAGLWLAFGHAHHGLTLGPATGRLLAELMTGAAPFVDAAPLSCTRFG